MPVAPAERQLVGEVTGLNLHRVKSMRAEPVDSHELTLKGIKGNRQLAFMKDGIRSGFPWFTARDNPQMLLYTPVLDAQTGAIDVTLPDGRSLPLQSDELRDMLREGSAQKPPIHLVRLDRGAYDGFPVSVISNETVRSIAQRNGIEPNSLRYRMDVEIETADRREGAEDSFVGGMLTFGDRDDSPQLLVVSVDPRCMMIGLDPKTAERNKQVVVDTARSREGNIGVYTTIAKAGIMKKGEPVYLTRL